MSNTNKPIWAPWRIDFIRSEKNNECFLCNKKSERNHLDEELIIAKYDSVFVIMNRYPYNPGHLLIAPYRHIGDISDLTKNERMELMDITIKAKNVLTDIMTPDGFNVGLNLGSAAGAGVKDHIHQHIVPRWEGDNNFMPVLGEIRVVPESLEATTKLLKQHWNKK